MEVLTNNEVDLVSGGCAEHCWGDFSIAGLAASMGAGALGGVRGGGWVGAAKVLFLVG